MYVSVTHVIHIKASPEEVKVWNDSRSLADIVKFDGFPAVVATESLAGDWVPGERAGDRRLVRFADGSQLVEEVLADSPGLFRYRISDFTSDQRFVVDHGLAEFRFAADDDGTRLEWTYSFLPMSADLRPVVEGFLETVMTPMMTATLTAMRDGVEATEL